MSEKTVNIVGLGQGGIDAPWKNEDESFWGINNAYIYGRLDRIFMLHYPEDTIRSSFVAGRETIPLTVVFKKYPRMEAISLDEFVFCKNLTNDLYSHAPISKLEVLKADPNYEVLFTTKRYPIKEAAALAGTSDFTCSATYLIAMAILEGYERIRLYGFEVWSGVNDEYTVEAPCIERWLSLARGRGIKTDISFAVVPTMRDKNSLYGYIKQGGRNEKI